MHQLLFFIFHIKWKHIVSDNPGRSLETMAKDGWRYYGKIQNSIIFQMKNAIKNSMKSFP